MAGILSYVPVAGRLVAASQPKVGSINIPPVPVHQIETNPDRRARCLKHLLKANHVNYAIVYDKFRSANHSPHLLSGAYLLGASEVQLHALYEGIKGLEPWTPSPAEIFDLDWTEFLGDRRYQRAYVDFFEDKLAMTFAYDWRQEAEHFLFSGEKPLVYGLIGGLGHPLVHMAYAYEMDCKEVGMEALALACVEYSFLYKYCHDASYTKPSPLASRSPLDLLTKMSEDERFDQLPKNIDAGRPEVLFEKHESLILEYWNAWELDEPSEQFQQSQEAAVSLAVTTFGSTYDPLLAHLLTTSHAVRVLLPFFPHQHPITLVRGWWLLAIIVCIIKGRPRPQSAGSPKGTEGKDWKYVGNRALASPWSKDAQFIQAVRAMSEAAKTWGDSQETYIGAAVKFVDNFEGWKS